MSVGGCGGMEGRRMSGQALQVFKANPRPFQLQPQQQ